MGQFLSRRYRLLDCGAGIIRPQGNPLPAGIPVADQRVAAMGLDEFANGAEGEPPAALSRTTSRIFSRL